MKSEKGKDPMKDISQTLKSVMFWVAIGTAITYIYNIIFKIGQALVIIAWLILLLAGIWSDDLQLLRIAGTIFISGCILLSLVNLFVVIYRLKNKSKKSDNKAEISDNLFMSIVASKIKTDPEFKKRMATTELKQVVETALYGMEVFDTNKK